MYFENQPTSPSPPPGDAGSKTLHQLARDGDTETIKLWFAESRNDPIKFINKLDEKKLSPLHYAARHSNIEVMKLLVENGADINKLGDDNMTPLHYTARYSCNNLTTTLIQISRLFYFGFFSKTNHQMII